MNLRQCWFRFQRATTKPSKRHSSEPSLCSDKKFPMHNWKVFRVHLDYLIKEHRSMVIIHIKIDQLS